MSPNPQKKIVLVVDDDKMIRRMLERNLKPRFDEVLTAAGPDEVVRLLAENKVTHLLCDCNLGPNVPTGCDMIPTWRKMQPSIDRAVIFSGSNLSGKKIPPEVDRVVSKTEKFEALLIALKIEEH